MVHIHTEPASVHNSALVQMCRGENSGHLCACLAVCLSVTVLAATYIPGLYVCPEGGEMAFLVGIVFL